MQSKMSLLKWLSTLLNHKVDSIEKLGRGIEYCLVLHSLDKTFPVRLVNQAARSESEFLRNLKLCQDYFARQNVIVHFPIERIARCKMQDNLEFVQWLYKFCNDMCVIDKIVPKEPVDVETTSPKRLANSFESSGCVKENNKKDYRIRMLESNVKDYEIKKNNSHNSSKLISRAGDIKTTPNESYKEIFRGSNNTEEISSLKTRLHKLESILLEKENEIAENHMKYNQNLEDYNISLKQNEDHISSLNKEIAFLVKSSKYKENEAKEQHRLELEEIKCNFSLREDKVLSLNEKLETALNLKNTELEELTIKHHEALESLKREGENRVSMITKQFQDKLNTVTDIINNIETERNFYYTRLKEIEMFLKGIGNEDGVCKAVFEIMYRKE